MTAAGFRVKSGYAIAVLLAGPVKAPTAIARHVVELCDPKIEDTRQPYHSGVGEAEEDRRAIERRIRIVERAAQRSVDALLRGVSHVPVAAGLVVGSVIDPSTVGNPHIRAHANEGRLFRTVLEEALKARGVTCSVVVEKTLAETARRQLERSDREITRALAVFGKALGSPWRAEEKAAATAAWLALDQA